MKIQWLGIVLALSIGSTRPEEFLYPVAAFTAGDGTPHLYLVYQKSPQHLELWLWDPATKHAAKALLSTFTPAGLCMLPDNSGFSFIDDGRIRIKKFKQRSPKTLDIFEPLYNLGPLTWADPGTAYFHAQEHSNFKIFQISLQSDLEQLVGGADVDCMYPSIINTTLFYIERTSDSAPDQELFHMRPTQSERYTYAIKAMNYAKKPYDPTPSFNNSERAQERIKALLQGDECQAKIIKESHVSTLLDVGKRPIAFLHMISADRGFYIEHPPVIDKYDQEIIFLCHQLTKDGCVWKTEYLFSFSLPTRLLMAESHCLYESVLPLLPRYCNGNLYYMTSEQEGNIVSIYTFDSSKRMPIKCTFQGCCFSPIECGDKVYYGGALETELPSSILPGAKDINSAAPRMLLQEDGQIGVELPYLSLSPLLI